QVAGRVAPHAAVRRRPHLVAAEAQRPDDGALQFGTADPVAGPELAVPRVVEHVHADADEGVGAGVRLAGGVPEPAAGIQLEVTGGTGRQPIGDGLPVPAGGTGPVDAAVGGTGVDVPVVVRSQAGGPAGHPAGAAGGVRFDVAVPRIVGVVLHRRSVLPRALVTTQRL